LLELAQVGEHLQGVPDCLFNVLPSLFVE